MEEERKFKSSITLKVLGQLVGEGLNQEKPQVVLNETPVEIKVTKERVITDTPKRRVRDVGNLSNSDTAVVKKKKTLDQPPAPNLTSGTEAPKKTDKKNKVNLNKTKAHRDNRRTINSINSNSARDSRSFEL